MDECNHRELCIGQREIVRSPVTLTPIAEEYLLPENGLLAGALLKNQIFMEIYEGRPTVLSAAEAPNRTFLPDFELQHTATFTECNYFRDTFKRRS